MGFSEDVVIMFNIFMSHSDGFALVIGIENEGQGVKINRHRNRQTDR